MAGDWTQGIRHAFAQFGGAGEADMRAEAEARAVQALTARARLDKTIADATMASRRNAAQESFGKLPNIDPTTLAVTLGNLGAYDDAQRGAGISQENEARAMALEMLRSAIAGGQAPPDADWLNPAIALANGKLLAPGNVSVDEQAAARIGAQEALAGKYGAQQGYAEAQAAERLAAAGVQDQRQFDMISDNERATLQTIANVANLAQDNARMDANAKNPTAPTPGVPEFSTIAAELLKRVPAEPVRTPRGRRGGGGGGKPKGAAPYPDGTRLRGPDGGTYVVRGGKPVPEQ